MTLTKEEEKIEKIIEKKARENHKRETNDLFRVPWNELPRRRRDEYRDMSESELRQEGKI